MMLGYPPPQPKTYQEKKEHAAMNFVAARSQPDVSETPPPVITEATTEFANGLGGSELGRIPVVSDEYGLFGWCSDGVREKVKHDGGSIVCAFNHSHRRCQMATEATTQSA
jgi:hypothetical protein